MVQSPLSSKIKVSMHEVPQPLIPAISLLRKYLRGPSITAVDWIPLSTGSVRPTQGRTLGIAQINGGSQSFNTVNVLRQLGRWMRMFTIPNQSSIPTAWKAYNENDRLQPSSNRDRLVDVCEELVKTTLLLLPHKTLLDDRYSEREERRAHGRLRTQAETEAAKDAKTAVQTLAAAKNGSEVA